MNLWLIPERPVMIRAKQESEENEQQELNETDHSTFTSMQSRRGPGEDRLIYRAFTLAALKFCQHWLSAGLFAKAAITHPAQQDLL